MINQDTPKEIQDVFNEIKQIKRQLCEAYTKLFELDKQGEYAKKIFETLKILHSNKNNLPKVNKLTWETLNELMKNYDMNKTINSSFKLESTFDNKKAKIYEFKKSDNDDK